MGAGHYLVIQRWRPEFDSFDENFKRMAIWIKTPEGHVEYDEMFGFYVFIVFICIGPCTGRPTCTGSWLVWASFRFLFRLLCIGLLGCYHVRIFIASGPSWINVIL